MMLKCEVGAMNNNNERDDTWAEVAVEGGYAYSPYEEGSTAALSSGNAKNPYHEDSYSWKEWERGYITTAKRESRGDDP